MINTRELRGSKQQIARQIEQVNGQIISAYVVVEEPGAAPFMPPSDEDFARLMKDLESLAVEAPKADYSREAMYTRMPGE
jgi:hypothetical protein